MGVNVDVLHARVRLEIVSASYGALVIASSVVLLLWETEFLEQEKQPQDLASAVRRRSVRLRMRKERRRRRRLVLNSKREGRWHNR